MADHDEVKNRFAQALKARREENRNTISARYEKAERALEPILARVHALKDGLDSLGDHGHQIHQPRTEAADNGDMAVDIVMIRRGERRTISVKAAVGGEGRAKLYLVGLMPEAAKTLGERTGAEVGGNMAVDLNTSHDVADAIEASAVEYFGEG